MKTFYAYRSHGDGTQEQPYVLCDETASGARLKVTADSVPAGEFLLSVGGNSVRRCVVAWQSAGEIGVKFVNPQQNPAAELERT